MRTGPLTGSSPQCPFKPRILWRPHLLPGQSPASLAAQQAHRHPPPAPTPHTHHPPSRGLTLSPALSRAARILTHTTPTLSTAIHPHTLTPSHPHTTLTPPSHPHTLNRLAPLSRQKLHQFAFQLQAHCSTGQPTNAPAAHIRPCMTSLPAWCSPAGHLQCHALRTRPPALSRT